MHGFVSRKGLDKDTPRGQGEISTWPGAMYVSVLSFHDDIVCMAPGRMGSLIPDHCQIEVTTLLDLNLRKIASDLG